MADYYDLRRFVTGAFYGHHLLEVRVKSIEELSAKDLAELAQKLAENVYQARDVQVNTIVVVGLHEAMELRAEVRGKQDAYAANPDAIQTTTEAYPIYARGTAAGKPAAAKRASYLGRRRFCYAVQAVEGEHGERFKVHHFEGLV